MKKYSKKDLEKIKRGAMKDTRHDNIHKEIKSLADVLGMKDKSGEHKILDKAKEVYTKIKKDKK